MRASVGLIALYVPDGEHQHPVGGLGYANEVWY